MDQVATTYYRCDKCGRRFAEQETFLSCDPELELYFDKAVVEHFLNLDQSRLREALQEICGPEAVKEVPQERASQRYHKLPPQNSHCGVRPRGRSRWTMLDSRPGYGPIRTGNLHCGPLHEENDQEEFLFWCTGL